MCAFVPKCQSIGYPDSFQFFVQPDRVDSNGDALPTGGSGNIGFTADDNVSDQNRSNADTLGASSFADDGPPQVNVVGAKNPDIDLGQLPIDTAALTEFPTSCHLRQREAKVRC